MPEAVKLVAEEQCNLDESLLIKVENKKYYFILVVYNPTNNKMEFLARLEETLECLSKKDCSVIICGDFNINILKKKILTAAYFDINSNGFELLNSDPTRFQVLWITVSTIL